MMKRVRSILNISKLHGFIIGFLLAWFLQQTFGRREFPPSPRFIPVPKNVTYKQGDSAILFCAVENLGTKSVTWRKINYITPIVSGNRVFVTDPRFASQHVAYKNEWNLIIQNVRLFDAGVYECQVSVRGETLRQNVTLSVSDNEEEFKPDIKLNGTRFVEKGDPIYLLCNASGEDYPPDKIEWFKNGDRLYTDPRNRVYIKTQISIHHKTLISILKISNSIMDDSGTYVCRTSNKLTTSMKIEILNAGTSNVKRGTLNHTSRTETINTKDTAMFLQSTAGTMSFLILVQYFIRNYIIFNPWGL